MDVNDKFTSNITSKWLSAVTCTCHVLWHECIHYMWHFSINNFNNGSQCKLLINWVRDYEIAPCINFQWWGAVPGISPSLTGICRHLHALKCFILWNPCNQWNRTPYYICWQPLKSGHLTIQDTSFCPKSVHIREVPSQPPTHHKFHSKHISTYMQMYVNRAVR